MASAFPGALDNYPANWTTTDPIRALGQDVDEHSSAINAIQAEVGALPRLATYGGNITLQLSDYNKTVEISSASSAVVTVPTNAAVAFPDGTVIEVVRMGTGAVTIAGASGVTIRNPTAVLTIGAQYGAVLLRKRGTNEWVIGGFLA